MTSDTLILLIFTAEHAKFAEKIIKIKENL